MTYLRITIALSPECVSRVWQLGVGLLRCLQSWNLFVTLVLLAKTSLNRVTVVTRKDRFLNMSLKRIEWFQWWLTYRVVQRARGSVGVCVCVCVWHKVEQRACSGMKSSYVCPAVFFVLISCMFLGLTQSGSLIRGVNYELLQDQQNSPGNST